MCYNIIVPRENGKRGQQYVGRKENLFRYGRNYRRLVCGGVLFDDEEHNRNMWGSECIRALRDIGIFKGVRIMLWMVVLDDGRYFTVEATCLMAVSMDLRDRGLITSDLDIVSVTRMVN